MATAKISVFAFPSMLNKKDTYNTGKQWMMTIKDNIKHGRSFQVGKIKPFWKCLKSCILSEGHQMAVALVAKRLKSKDKWLHDFCTYIPAVFMDSWRFVCDVKLHIHWLAISQRLATVRSALFLLRLFFPTSWKCSTWGLKNSISETKGWCHGSYGSHLLYCQWWQQLQLLQEACLTDKKGSKNLLCIYQSMLFSRHWYRYPNLYIRLMTSIRHGNINFFFNAAGKYLKWNS